MIVLDGSEDEDWQWTGSGDTAYAAILNYINIGAVISPVGYVVSDTFNTVALSHDNTVIGIGGWEKQLYLRDPSKFTSKSTLRSYLQSHPLIVFYKSVDYTPEADIAVALERRKHYMQIVQNVRGTPISGDEDHFRYHMKTPNAAIADTSNQTALSSHYSLVAPADTDKKLAGFTIVNGNMWIYDNGETEEEFNAYLQAQITAGTPVQVVYELASAATYAHPIQTESLPAYYGTEDFVTALAGEPVTDKWLTFTNDGAQLNFKGGGGVGVSKLAATTAVPADVVQGKTFYSKDKTLKTGTIVDRPALNDAVSVGNDGSHIYYRINQGAYRTNQATGYPEIRASNNSVISNIPGGNNGAWSGTYSGSNVTIPRGYHNGSGSVGVAGGNRGNWGTTLNMGGSATVPQGYHNGGGVVRARTASGQSSVFATANGNNWAQVAQVCKARAETTINVSVNGTTVRVWGELHTWIEGNGGYVGNDLRTGYDQSFSIGQV